MCLETEHWARSLHSLGQQLQVTQILAETDLILVICVTIEELHAILYTHRTINLRRSFRRPTLTTAAVIFLI